MTKKPTKKIPPTKFDLVAFTGKDGQFYFHLKRNSNGRIVMASEGYVSKGNCLRAARNLKKDLFRPDEVLIIHDFHNQLRGSKKTARSIV